MRVAYLNAYGNGSTGRIIDLLKKLCQMNGIESKSFFSREFCASPETSVRLFSKIGFYNDALMTRIFDNHGLNSISNTKKLINKLKEFKPDIIHIHNLHGYWTNYELLFKYIKSEKIKVVFTLHDCWSFTGHCTHFDFIKCNKWQTGCYKCPQKCLYPKSSFLDGSKRNYIRKKKAFTSLNSNQMIIVTPSNWLKEKVEQSFLNKYKSLVINNGVNINVFKQNESDLRQKYGLKNKKVILAVANYWDERKGLEYVIECAKKRTDWFFVCIGQEKAKKTYDGDNILRFSRTESQAELAKWYSTSDVYLNTTLEDTYPTTNLEALACGTPVVTFNTGGSPESVSKTGFGVVVEKDVDSIIEGINNALINFKKADFDRKMLDSDNNFYLYIREYKKLFEQ